MTIDTEQLKQAIDLRDLAGQSVELRRESSTEMSGPCPKCGGTDRFHVKADWFFCRQCNEKGGDAIAFVQWLEGLDFRAACERLSGRAVSPPAPAHRRQPERKPGATSWKAPAWQTAAQAALARAQDRLWNQPEGEPGRAYLEGRGLRLDAWLAFDLGYGPAWNPARQEELPAIWLPWQNRRITAIQYRFIGEDVDKGERFSQKGGGDRLLFGVHLLGKNPAGADTLILCEGELNACSLWQECYREHPADVASWGPKDNLRPEVIRVAAAVAKRYQRVIVWADEPEDAVKALQALGAVEALRSPDGMDANDLLQRGWLAGLVAELLDESVKVAA